MNLKHLKGSHMVEETVPEKYKEWAERCKEGVESYVDLNDNAQEYYKNFMEIDARKAGRTIDKYVRGKAFGNFSDKFSDIFFSSGIANKVINK